MSKFPRETAYSLIELLVALSLFSVLCSLAVIDYTELQNPADNAGRAMYAYFKTVQGKSMATTSTYTVWPVSSTEIRATSAASCSSAEQLIDAELRFVLPSGAHIGNLDWQICYNSRGLANNSADISVNDSRVSRVLRLALGGGVKLE
ncbi:MAG: type II secretion system protein [SAR324 cluster bacterium]|uniref:Type II secretion system protein n=1 Tax=SAR324 cluster bacterium TaxID=2024889 RepID=A0A7X9FUA6_9DELT|nr:type II secretion system protein [SAR324 cluster bacterium]